MRYAVCFKLRDGDHMVQVSDPVDDLDVARDQLVTVERRSGAAGAGTKNYDVVLAKEARGRWEALDLDGEGIERGLTEADLQAIRREEAEYQLSLTCRPGADVGAEEVIAMGTAVMERPAVAGGGRQPETADVPMVHIRQSKFNPRQRFDEAELRQLADSIREHGLLQPIVLREIDREGSAIYEIVAGERRWRASQLLELKHIRATVLPISEIVARELALIENLERRDIDPIEAAEGYRQLLEIGGYTQAKLGERINRSQAVVANTLRLLKLPPDVQDMIRDGKLTAAHGVALLRMPEIAQGAIAYVAAHAVAYKQTVADLEKPLDYNMALDLSRKGLCHVFTGREAFDPLEVCKTRCPYSAYRGSQYGMGVCFVPAHFKELQEEALRTQAAVQAARLAEVGAGSSSEVVDLSKLGWDKYEDLSYGKRPAGCDASCVCRREGLQGNGTKIPVCIDPKRYAGLKAAQTRAEKKAKQEALNVKMDALRARLDSLTSLDDAREEIGVLASLALQHGSHPCKQAAAKRVGINPTSAGRDEALKVIQYAIEAHTLHEVQRCVEYGNGYGTEVLDRLSKLKPVAALTPGPSPAAEEGSQEPKKGDQYERTGIPYKVKRVRAGAVDLAGPSNAPFSVTFEDLAKKYKRVETPAGVAA